MSPQRPRRLHPGDKVALVAPAGPLVPEVLDKGIAILESWGLEVTVAAGARDTHPAHSYLAGTDEVRARDLQTAWCDPTVAAVFCARGGYGCLRILDLLDWEAMAAAAADQGPKLLVGSSDVTALHQVLGARLNVATLFSPMVGTGSFTDNEIAQEHLRRTLFEPETVRRLAGPDAAPLVEGRARGVTVGGNLSLVVSGRGVPDVPGPPDGAIGLLEDVTEEPYRLDHFLTHLRRAGWFDNLGGVVLGSWDECGEDPAAVRAVLADRVGDLGIPVIWELGFGHCAGTLTVPLGVEAELVSGPDSHLLLTQEALA